MRWSAHFLLTKLHSVKTPQLLGVTDDAVQAPVRATMDTVSLGTAQNGTTAHMDTLAGC